MYTVTVHVHYNTKVLRHIRPLLHVRTANRPTIAFRTKAAKIVCRTIPYRPSLPAKATAYTIIITLATNASVGNRVVDEWNLLTEAVISSLTVNGFKNKLERHLIKELSGDHISLCISSPFDQI